VGHVNDVPKEPKTESHDPSVPEAYAAFMRTGWENQAREVPPHPITPWAVSRRARLAADTDYRFRPDTAHTYFCGNQTSDAVLVIEPDGASALYARPRSGRESDEFFRDRQYGALWVGRRPSLGELEAALGIPVKHIDDLPGALSATAKTRVHRGLSHEVDTLVPADEMLDADLARVISEMRLIKDEWELGELQTACDITTLGFEDSVSEWDQVLQHGERWLEGTFFRRARTMGNDLGYDSIVAGGAHATTLHWIDNSGPIVPGELVLCDMGVEGRNLYTADVTRTMPVTGTFSPLQRDLYTLVLRAQDAGIAALRPDVPFLAGHDAAMAVLAHGLGDLGLLPVSAEEALDPESRVYARWTLHGTSHMLGMDVHDCGRAAPESYRDGTLAEGMVLTVEPGLYFQEDDLLVPEELRGIGIRIEDDVVVTSDGVRNLSEALPREPDAVEEWMARLRG
jgi:Xaa-Pro aminopeptidase